LLFVGVIAGNAGLAVAQNSIKNRPVWTGCAGDAVIYGDLASRVAPVLWFSPDEPLLKPDPKQQDVPLRSLRGADIPAPIPALNTPPKIGGSSNSQPVQPAVGQTVYYRIRLLRVRDGVDQASFRMAPGAHDRNVPLDQVTSIYIRFFFYYPSDVGFGSHTHDLESVEMTLDVSEDKYKPGCYEVRLFRVSGAAHGVGWYTNTLNIYDTSSDPILLPPVVLVEEGKHATVPDRNGDGTYSPGYDVNVNPNDAWGIRDGLRNNRQTGSSYNAESAKPRHKMHRLFPEKFRGFQDSGESSVADRDQKIAEFHYKLKEGGVNDENCQNGSVSPLQQNGRKDEEWSDARRLHEFLSKTSFCAPTAVKKPNPHSGTGGRGVTLLAAPYGSGVVSWSDRFSWGYSYVAGQGGDSAQGMSAAGGIGLGLGSLTGGWLVPRLSAHHESGSWTYGVDALYTPSVSRIVDWYLAVGVDVAKDQTTAKYGAQTVEEFGIKLRVGWEPLIKHGFGFINFRLGYRGPLQSGLANGRWVIETGFGGGF
jgi:hypothetical protein